LAKTFLHNQNELLPLLISGDEIAFRQLFDEYIQPLSYFALQLCGDRQEAEDIASITFHKFWERHASFSSLAGIKSFLFTTTRNHCLNFLKHKKVVSAAEKKLTGLVENESWADAKMVHTDLLQRIYAEIEALPPQHKEIVIMSFVEGLSTQEIAEKLNRTNAHIRADKSRALVILRNALAKKNLLEAALMVLAALR
jgi:RNA polymerase sigma-70 factor (ECF subfamily)